MKEFKYNDINKRLLKALEDCDDSAAIKAYLAENDFDISIENADKLYEFINGLHEMSDDETAKTSGGGCSPSQCPD